ncbi:15048_t:CDS:1, partial [Cetraspora pellucida]
PSNNNNTDVCVNENDEEEVKKNELIKELYNNLEEITIEQDKILVIPEFFNLTMLEIDQILDNDLSQINEEPNSSVEDEW